LLGVLRGLKARRAAGTASQVVDHIRRGSLINRSG